VIAKWAQTLDGRIAAADGTSFWISGEQAREHAHAVRAEADAMVVGTGTVLADNPMLSARPNGVDSAHQPLRVIMGLRDTTGLRVWRDGNVLAARTHDPAEVLAMLAAREIRTVVVEGGSTVVTAFLAAGLVDEIHAYVAPALLGEGTPAIGPLGIATMAEALRAQRIESVSLGADTLIRALVADQRD
jgi:diaminohydroxyphosphoribosylaminopyrimidine deaminase/5-amino-6-(5-phosphoribosylamino)uracil reductase